MSVKYETKGDSNLFRNLSYITRTRHPGGRKRRDFKVKVKSSKHQSYLFKHEFKTSSIS